MSLKRLYILRHGNAEPYHHNGDANRSLTQFGIDEVISTANQFFDSGEIFSQVFVSPYRRAQETADYFLKTMGFSGSREVCNLITPNGKPFKVLKWLSEKSEIDSILLITHQPLASELAEMLSTLPLPNTFTMKTASIAAFDGEMLANACCDLRWQIHPSH